MGPDEHPRGVYSQNYFTKISRVDVYQVEIAETGNLEWTCSRPGRPRGGVVSVQVLYRLFNIYIGGWTQLVPFIYLYILTDDDIMRGESILSSHVYI